MYPQSQEDPAQEKGKAKESWKERRNGRMQRELPWQVSELGEQAALEGECQGKQGTAGLSVAQGPTRLCQASRTAEGRGGPWQSPAAKGLLLHLLCVTF